MIGVDVGRLTTAAGFVNWNKTNTDCGNVEVGSMLERRAKKRPQTYTSHELCWTCDIFRIRCVVSVCLFRSVVCHWYCILHHVISCVRNIKAVIQCR